MLCVATCSSIRTWTVRQPMASKHFWCSSKAPWSAKTPINGVDDDSDVAAASFGCCCGQFIFLLVDGLFFGLVVDSPLRIPHFCIAASLSALPCRFATIVLCVCALAFFQHKRVIFLVWLCKETTTTSPQHHLNDRTCD
jgi:hypothetical protein